MAEDRSLDDFVDGGSDTDGSATPTDDSNAGKKRSEGEKPAEDDDSTAGPNADRVRPARSTATWTTEGAACDRCGEDVERRWVDDDAIVCAACKSW